MSRDAQPENADFLDSKNIVIQLQTLRPLRLASGACGERVEKPALWPKEGRQRFNLQPFPFIVLVVTNNWVDALRRPCYTERSLCQTAVVRGGPGEIGYRRALVSAIDT